jgi:hypothetical protein
MRKRGKDVHTHTHTHTHTHIHTQTFSHTHCHEILDTLRTSLASTCLYLTRYRVFTGSLTNSCIFAGIEHM